MSSVTQAFRSCLVGGLVLGFAASAWAQTGTASLVGEVSDQQKQVIPGATITLSNRQTGVVQSTVSDERGAFRFVSMRPGRYDMKVELAGFKMALTEDIPLAVDSTVRQNAILELGGVNETVSVVSQTITLNTTDASLGNAISTEQIRNLPIEAQNVVQLLSLQPGAVFVPVQNPATTDPRTVRWPAREPISRTSRSTVSMSTIPNSRRPIRPRCE